MCGVACIITIRQCDKLMERELAIVAVLTLHLSPTTVQCVSHIDAFELCLRSDYSSLTHAFVIILAVSSDSRC